VPYFQPIVRAEDGSVAAYEVLMRLVVEGRALPAGDFVEIAEESGIISRLDLIVMEEAFRMAAERGFGGLLFVNISPRAVVAGDFLPSFRRLLRESGISPRQVVVEITERETVRNASLLEIFVSELKRDGTRFAIDDFGSGFSSMTYLKRFSVDFLKIEGDFIRSLPDPESLDRAIVAAIVTLAREAGIRTVAESVESPEILELVRSFGIDYAQGFTVGRPLPGIP
ncbi:MAG: EAL domain-containing protein, partial [Nitrospirae bacterium]|nr:EAL domain-containing protein [Nitrospirota bacterium]